MKKQSLLIALLCVAVFSTMAFAAGKKAPGPNTTGVQVAQSLTAPASTKHVLKGTYTNGGILNFTMPAGTFVALDAATVVCPIGTCTLLADAFATSGGDTATGNRALCIAVNGGIVGSCPYSGEEAADGSYSQIAHHETGFTFSVWVTVQPFAFTGGTPTISTFPSKYSVYKP